MAVTESIFEAIQRVILGFQTSAFLQKSATAGVIIMTGLLAAHFISKFVGLMIKKFGLEDPLKKRGIKNAEHLLEQASHNIILVIAFILALNRLGILQTVASIAGLTILAIIVILVALNFKDLLTNFFAGTVLHALHRDIKPGVKIKSGNLHGKVESFGWTETKIITAKKEIMIVPNSFLFKNRVTVIE